MCTDGATALVDLRWPDWSSKKMCGLRTARTRPFSIPPRKNASFAMTPQLLSVFRARSWDGALAAPLLFSRELYITACLYLVYLGNAMFALRHWRALAPQETQQMDRS